jgi:predicted translin family RNA/ssDNA-binding protein
MSTVDEMGEQRDVIHRSTETFRSHGQEIARELAELKERLANFENEYFAEL